MPTYEEIKQHVEKLDGASRWLGRKDFKELPNVLWDDEMVEKVVQGRYEHGNGILVATNKRLIFVDKGMVKLRVEDFPYDKITTIQYKTGFALGSVQIYASGNKAEIEHIDKKQVRDFSDYVRARITAISAHASVPSQTAVGSEPGEADVADQIRKLATLRDEGILTEEEFSAKKTQLLGL